MFVIVREPTATTPSAFVRQYDLIGRFLVTQNLALAQRFNTAEKAQNVAEKLHQFDENNTFTVRSY